jgi:hypothetical protein
MADLEHDIDDLEAKIRTAMEEVKNLDNGLLEGVLDEIRLPGWTSSAEYVFTIGLTEALIDHLVVARRMQGVLIAGARRVETPSLDVTAIRACKASSPAAHTRTSSMAAASWLRHGPSRLALLDCQPIPAGGEPYLTSCQVRLEY